MPVVQAVAAHLPLDWVSLGLFAALVAIDAAFNGTRRACAFSLAALLSLLLWDYLPQTAFVSGFTDRLSALEQALAFALLFGVLFLLIYRMIPAALTSGAYPLQALLAGLAAALVLAIVWLQVPALDDFFPFSGLLHTLFGPAYRLWWLLGSYAAFAFAVRA